jgi:hypothetical protein
MEPLPNMDILVEIAIPIAIITQREVCIIELRLLFITVINKMSYLSVKNVHHTILDKNTKS